MGVPLEPHGDDETYNSHCRDHPPGFCLPYHTDLCYRVAYCQFDYCWARSAEGQASSPLALGDAVTQSIAQASSFQQARIEELIAAEDVRQARLAFLSRLTSPLSFIYNSPALGPNAQPGVQSFIAANAIREYEALVGVTGDLDLSGRLRASLRRSVALLEAARAGTEVARRALVQG